MIFLRRDSLVENRNPVPRETGSYLLRVSGTVAQIAVLGNLLEGQATRASGSLHGGVGLSAVIAHFVVV